MNPLDMGDSLLPPPLRSSTIHDSFGGIQFMAISLLSLVPTDEIQRAIFSRLSTFAHQTVCRYFKDIATLFISTNTRIVVQRFLLSVAATTTLSATFRSRLLHVSCPRHLPQQPLVCPILHANEFNLAPITGQTDEDVGHSMRFQKTEQLRHECSICFVLFPTPSKVCD